ncbi:hypothetical protein KEF85_05580 [Methylomonas paludis]|uniref:Major royal jelly protein n=1 Tax=Methylomonas paludis TaxID=1173101 RepID=A0A975RB17_9GAMM|nr:L-dopachrome tautomerase-related protein [Methylomonas paludis]QWF71928.1 hypothetical protein KEF85_05580 [Methylomonas paludis]
MKIFRVLALLFCGILNLHAEINPGYSVVARVSQGPGNITVTRSGRTIISLHQFYQPAYSVAELLDNGVLKPFPNQEWNDRTTTNKDLKLDSVLGIRSANGVIWLLDNGMRSGITPKLVGWNCKKDVLQQVIYLPPSVIPKDAFINDFVVDLRHNRIYISDPAGGVNAAIIVVNLDTGAARRVLQGHSSVVPEALDLVINQRPVQIKTTGGEMLRPRIGVNPITADLQNEWVYYGAMHGLKLYRVKAADLANEYIDDQALAQRVETYSAKPISDGISIDQDSNIYLGELAENAVGVIKSADRQYQRLAQGPELAWVDSLSFGPEGKLYAVVNKLHQSGFLNGGDAVSKPPYLIIQIPALAGGMAGR